MRRLSAFGAVAAHASFARTAVIGEPSKGVRKAGESQISFVDFVGTSGIPARLAAGSMLSVMDITAARTAAFHCRPFGERRTSATHVRVATVGVDNTTFIAPVLHGDAVEVVGTVVSCGKSSCAVHVAVSRLQYSGGPNAKNLVAESFFTMCTIDETLRATPLVPAVELESAPLLRLSERYRTIRDTQRSISEYEAKVKSGDLTLLTAAALNDPINQGKRAHVRMSDTLCRGNRMFLNITNPNETVFGGEILRFAEQHATHAARMFTGNKHVYSIGMGGVSFRAPIYETDWVTTTSRVVYVRNTTLEVETRLHVTRDGEEVTTNTANFIMISTDEVGQKQQIANGLLLDGAPASELADFAVAQYRYKLSRERHHVIRPES